MSDQLSMFSQRTSEAFDSATGLAGLEAGQQPFDSPDGLTTEKYGQGRVLANPSRAQAPKLGATIRATFGRRGFASSASADLTASLVSRLRQHLDMDGSILFAMTWKEKGTPSGRVVSQVQCRARSTSGSGYGSWPSPVVGDVRTHVGTTLTDAAKLAGWPTPNTPSGGRSVSIESMDATGRTPDGKKHTASLEHAVKFANWPTPRAEDSESTGAHRGNADTLTSASRLASWATPTTRDHKDGNSEGTAPTNALLGRQVWEISGPMSPGSPAETGKRGQLNPAFSLWLQGYPVVWLLAAPSKRPQPRFRKRKRRASSAESVSFRGAGNSIKPQVAAAFISAYLSLD